MIYWLCFWEKAQVDCNAKLSTPDLSCQVFYRLLIDDGKTYSQHAILLARRRCGAYFANILELKIDILNAPLCFNFKCTGESFMSHCYSVTARAALCALFLLALSPTAQASIVIDYSVASSNSFSLEGDSAFLSSFTYSTTLIDGESGDYAIGFLNFNVGTSPSAAYMSFNADRAFTINGVSETLLQDLTLNIWHYDTVSVTGGDTTTIVLGGGQFVDVTPIAFSKNNSGTFSSDAIYATFLLYTVPQPTTSESVPEPTSIGLMAIGVLGLFGASRKRKQDKA